MGQESIATLTEPQRQQARQTLVAEGVFSRMMESITGGAFLAGLALYVGASTLGIAVLAALPFLAQVGQLVAVPLLTRRTDRKRIVLVASGSSRALLLVVAAGVLASGSRFGATPLIVVMALSALLTVISTAAWNWWVRDVIPRGELGQYFGRRLRITTAVAAVVQLGAGAMLDAFSTAGSAGQGYATLFFLGGAAGLASTFLLGRTPHVRPAPPAPVRGPLRVILEPLRDPGTRRLAASLTLVAATLTIALPYTAVFLIRTLSVSFFAIAVLTAISQLGYVGGLRGWGYLSDRFGNRPVLQIALGMLVVALIGWALVLDSAVDRLLVPLGVLHFVSGFAVGGIELMANNLLLKTAPEGRVPAYMASLSFTRAVTAGVATLAAGAVWEAMGTGALWTVEPAGLGPWSVRGFHVLAAASAIVGLAGLVSFSRVTEPGFAPVTEVAKAMRREVRMISSVAGIRAFVHVVSYAVELFARPPTEPEPQRRAGELPASGPPPSQDPKTRGSS